MTVFVFCNQRGDAGKELAPKTLPSTQEHQRAVDREDLNDQLGTFISDLKWPLRERLKFFWVVEPSLGQVPTFGAIDHLGKAQG